MNYCVDCPDGELEFRNEPVLLQPDKEDMIATENTENTEEYMPYKKYFRVIPCVSVAIILWLLTIKTGTRRVAWVSVCKTSGRVRPFTFWRIPFKLRVWSVTRNRRWPSIGIRPPGCQRS